MSLCFRWMSEVAMKMWMPGRLAFSTARMARVDVGLARARQAEARSGADTASATRATDSKSPSDEAAKPGLDDVDAELLELARDHHLLLHVHRRARRLLAVAQRRVEDLYRVRSRHCRVPPARSVTGPARARRPKQERATGDAARGPSATRNATGGVPARGVLRFVVSLTLRQTHGRARSSSPSEQEQCVAGRSRAVHVAGQQLARASACRLVKSRRPSRHAIGGAVAAGDCAAAASAATQRSAHDHGRPGQAYSDESRRTA